MRFTDMCSMLLEKYSSSTMGLKHYLSDDKFDVTEDIISWVARSGWLDEHDDVKAELERIYGTVLDMEEMEETSWEYTDAFHKLPDSMKKELEGSVKDNAEEIWPDDADRPSTFYFTYGSLLKRTTWLVHFSDDPWDIKRDGFIYGTDRMDRLGLTTYIRKEGKKFGGYNFAFEAGSRHAKWAAAKKKYGEHAVMFQNAGVKAWHSGDEEDQVIFWGKDVSPADLVVLWSDGDGWHVARQRQGKGQSEFVFSADKYENAEKWVMQNFNQYRNVIT